MKDELSRGPWPKDMDSLTKAALAVGIRKEARRGRRTEGRVSMAIAFLRCWQGLLKVGVSQSPWKLTQHSKVQPQGKKEGKDWQAANKCFLCQKPGNFARVCPECSNWQGMVGGTPQGEEEVPQMQGNGKAWLVGNRGSNQAGGAAKSPDQATPKQA